MKITNPLLILNDPHGGDEEAPLVKGAMLTARVLDSPEGGPVKLQLGPRVIQAIMSQYVEPGSQIRLLVEQVHPRLILNLVDDGSVPLEDARDVQPQSAKPEPAPQAAPARADAIPRNAILARILDLPSANAVRLQILPHPDDPARAYTPKEGTTLFPGQTFDAKLVRTEATTDLRPGQDLIFRVTRTTPSLMLQIDQSITPTAGKSSLIQAAAHYLGSPQSVANAASELQSLPIDNSRIPPEAMMRLQAVQTLLNALSPDGSKADVHFLDRAMAILGLAGDRPELRDEIAKLLTHLATAAVLKDHTDHQAIKLLAETSARLFEAIEQLHGLNREGIRQEQTLLIPFPLFWAEAKGGGEIRLAWSGEGNDADGSGAPFRVTLLLDLSQLGKIKVDAELRGKTMRAMFWTETARARTVLVQSFDRLQNSLSAWGLNVESLLARQYPAQQRMPDSLAEEIIQGSTLVNVRV